MRYLLPGILILLLARSLSAQSAPLSNLVIVGLPDTITLSEGADTVLFLDDYIQIDPSSSKDLDRRASPSHLHWDIFQTDDLPALRADKTSRNSITLRALDEKLDREKREIVTVVRFEVSHRTSEFNSASASLVVRLVPIDDPPHIKSDITSIEMLEDTPKSISLENAAEDEDTQASLLNWEITKPGRYIGAAINGKTLSLEPQEGGENYNGPDTIEVTVSDATSRISREVGIRIEAVNDPPIISGETKARLSGTIRVSENNDFVIDSTVVDLAVEDADNLNQELRWRVAEGNTEEISLRFHQVRGFESTEWKLVIQPAKGFFTPQNEPSDFRIEVSDGELSDTANLSVVVDPEPDRPGLLLPSSLSIPEDSTLSLNLDIFVSVEQVVESKENIRWELLGSFRTKGSIDRVRTAIFQPEKDWNGVEEVRFRATGLAGSAEQVVRITVEARPDTPAMISNLQPGFQLELQEDEPKEFSAKRIAEDPDVDDRLSIRPHPSFLSVENPLVSVRETRNLEEEGIIVIPNPEASGTTRIRLIVSDQTGLSDTGFVDVVVRPVNDLPRIVPGGVTFDEDTRHTVLLDGFVRDVDDPPELMRWANPVPVLDDSVTAEIDSLRRTITFTPKPNFHGRRPFWLTATDTSNQSATDTISVHVGSVNDAPAFSELLPSEIVLEEDSTFVIDLRRSASDIDNDREDLTWNIESSDDSIAVNIAGGFAAFEPKVDWNGRRLFRVAVSDPDGGLGEAVVRVTVTPVNDPPVVSLSSIPFEGGRLFEEGDTLAVDLAPFVEDVDNDDGEIEWTCGQSAHIRCRVEEGIAVLWTIDPQWRGTERIRFIARDPENLQSAQPVLITVAEVDDCPDVSRIPDITLPEDQVSQIDLDDYVSDLDTPLAAISWAHSSTDSISIELDRSFHTVTFTPEKDFYGRRDVTFEASGGCGQIQRRTVTVRVEAVNDPTTLRVSSVSFKENNKLTLKKDSLLVDIDDLAENLGWNIRALGNIIALREDGSFTLSAPLNFSGKDSVEVTIADPRGFIVIDTLNVVVEEVNNPPDILLLPSYISFPEDTDTTSLSLNDFFSDVDTPKEQAKWSAIFPDDSLSVVIDPFTYIATFRAAKDFHGVRRVVFSVVDDYASPVHQISDTVQVEVIPVNDPPIINPLPLRFTEDQSLVLDLSALGDDVDNDDSQLRWDIRGTRLIEVLPEGRTFRLRAPKDSDRSDVISVTVFDFEDSTSARLDVIVEGENDPPDISSLPAETSFDEDPDPRFSLDLDDYLDDIDTPKNQIQWQAENILDDSVAVSINRNSHVATFFPDEHFFGRREIMLTAIDNRGEPRHTISRTLTVVVRGVNDPPDLQVPNYEFNEGDSLRINLRGIVRDIDTDFNDLRWKISGKGILRTRIDREWLVLSTQRPDDNGRDPITIIVSDPEAQDSATVFVNILEINDPPVIESFPRVDLREDESISLFIGTFISDVDHPPESLRIRAVSNFGTVQAEGWNLRIVPAHDYCGSGLISLTVQDPSDGSTVHSFDVNVACINDPPQFSLDQIDLVEDQRLGFRLQDLIKDSDNDLSDLEVEFELAPHILSEVFKDSVVFTPAADWHGEEVLLAQISDSESTIQRTVVARVDSVFDVVHSGVVIPEDGEYLRSLDGFLQERRRGERVFWRTADSEHLKVDVDNILNTIKITPDADWFGEEKGFLLAEGSNGRSDADSILVNVEPVNDPPLLNLEGLTIPEDSTLTLNLRDFVADIDGLVSEIQCAPSSSFFTISTVNERDPCVVDITPPRDTSGIDTLEIEIVDIQGEQTKKRIPVDVPARPDEFTFSISIEQPVVIRENGFHVLDLRDFLEGIDGDDSIVDSQRLRIFTETTHSQIFTTVRGSSLEIFSYDFVGAGSIMVVLEDMARGGTLRDTLAVQFKEFRPPRICCLSPELSFNEDDSRIVILDTLATDPDNRVQALEWFVTPDTTKPVTVRFATVFQESESGRIDTFRTAIFSSRQPDWNGLSSAVFIVRDPDGYEDSATVAIQVIPVNDIPRIRLALSSLLEKGVGEDDSLVVLLDTSFVWDDDPVESLIWRFEVEGEKADSLDALTRLSISPDEPLPAPRLVLMPKPDWKGQAMVRYFAVDRFDSASSVYSALVHVRDVPDSPRLSEKLPSVITIGKSRQFTMPLMPFAQDPDGDLLTWSFNPLKDEQTSPVKLRSLTEGQLSIIADPLWERGGPANIQLTVRDRDSLVFTPLMQVFSDPRLEFLLPPVLEPIEEDRRSPILIPGANFPPGTRVRVETMPRSAISPRLEIEGNNTLIPTLPSNWFGTMTLLFDIPFTFPTEIPRPSTTVANATLETVPVNDPPNPFRMLEPIATDTLLSSAEFGWEQTVDPDKGDRVEYVVRVAPDTSFTTGLRETVVEGNSVVLDVVDSLSPGPAQRFYWQVIAQDQKRASTIVQDQFRQFFVKGAPRPPLLSINNLKDGFLRERTARLSWTPFRDPDGDLNEEYRIFAHTDRKLVETSGLGALVDLVRADANQFLLARTGNSKALEDSLTYYAKVETRSIRFDLSVSGMAQFTVDLPKILPEFELLVPPAQAEFNLRTGHDEVDFEWTPVVSLNQADSVHYKLAWWSLGRSARDTVWADAGAKTNYHAVRREFVNGPYGWKVRAESQYGGFIETQADTFHIGIEKTILDLSNYPNPMGVKEETNIEFRLSRRAFVTIRIFDESGALVRVLAEEREVFALLEEIKWDGRDEDGRPVARGVYLCQLQAKPAESPQKEDAKDHWIAVFHR